MKTKVFLFCLMLSYAAFPQNAAIKFSEILAAKVGKSGSGEKIAAWVFFADKGTQNAKWKNNPELYLTQRSLERRALRGMTATIVDETDYPLSGEYTAAVKQSGASIRQRSKWLNGLSINATREQLQAIASLPFVKNLDIVYQLKKEKPLPPSPAAALVTENPKNTNVYDYGQSLTQLQQIKVPDVHNLGIIGEGVIVCVMDAGFNRLAHEAFTQMQIIATYDFVNHRIGVGDSTGLMGEGSHGTQTLSTIGGFKSGQLIGPAFKAKYILAKTENTDSETPIEEDNWIAAAEFADSLGADVTSTSLGYITFDSPYTSYTWQSMDGETCRITQAADIAVTKGIVVVNSAGNEGSNSTHNTLGAPADGKWVISVGAVTSSGTRSYFSSVGNTVDGRTKPDVMAMGSSVRVASPYSSTGYTSSDGTSFSGPLAGGVAALIVCARPYLNPIQVREAMRKTASRASNPDREYGWGILNALNAINYFPAIAPPVLVAPLNFAVVQTTGNTLVWNKVANATAYKVQLSTNSAFSDLVINDTTITDTMRAVPQLAMNTTYYWRVATKTASAVSQYSSAGIFKTTAVSVTWQSSISVRNAANENQILTAGMSSQATDGIDAALGETTLPPVPPTGVFTSYFELPVTPLEFSYRDFRKDTNKVASWVIKFQAGDGGYPVNLSWDQSTLPTGNVLLKDLVTGSLINVNMKTQSSYQVTNTGITGVKIEYTKQVCKTIDLASGWNIVSIPLLAGDMSAVALFASANSPAYGYNNGYTTAATLANGKGYWIRQPQAGTSSVCGTAFGNTIPLVTGWNLVGVNENDYPTTGISTTPAGILSSQFYGYSGGYSTPATLQAGKGYWIRASQAGVINLANATAKAHAPVPAVVNPDLVSKISVTDNAGNRVILGLYNNNTAVNTQLNELPPMPPAGVFDCRFANNTTLESAGSAQIVQLQSASYPVTLSVEGANITVRDAATNGRLFNASSSQNSSMVIGNPAVSALVIESDNIPGEYTLNKNYPNPFNPSTIISCNIPAAGKASIKVYDLLGNQVAVLFNGAVEAGVHKYEFNASGLASGLYIYELRAGGKIMQNKMLLLK